MANQFLSLALFLMLLSFFIVMNALSTFEDSKSKPVVSSVVAAFSTQIINKDREKSATAPEVTTPDDDTIGQGDTLESLEGLFDAHVSGFEVARNRFGTVMHVRTSVGSFENAIDMIGVDYDTVPVGERGSFAQTMVAILRSEKKKQPYRVDLILNIPEDSALFQKESPDDFIKSLKRVSDFAETLEKAGLPRKMISAGLGQGEVGFIDLYFYRYKPFDMVAELKKAQADERGL